MMTEDDIRTARLAVCEALWALPKGVQSETRTKLEIANRTFEYILECDKTTPEAD